MKEKRHRDFTKTRRQFLVILCFVTVVIIVLICVAIYLGVRTGSCNDSETLPRKVVERSVFGNHGGQNVYEYTMKNKNNIEVSIINYGAIITKILVPDRNGKRTDIALGYDDMKGYSVNAPWIGAIIGRYANRIANGTFSLDGQTYNLTLNDGPNTLHGGVKGFDKRIWESSASDDFVSLQYTSADMEEGYPGEVKVRVTYQLTDDNELKIEYSATTTKKTIINLTNHAYFNLGGQGPGTVFDHNVTIFAEYYTPFDSTFVPIGPIEPVAGMLIDLRKKQNLGATIPLVPGGIGYNVNYCFGKTGWKKYMARVEHPPSGRYVELYSTEPGLQFYTAHYLNDTGKGGAKYEQYGAFCLEAQHYPDSPNQPHYPTTVLAPGEVYLQSTIYKFGSE